MGTTDYSLYLKRGKENAMPTRTLADAAGFHDIRSLRADIAKSRAAGQVICSSTTGGYYLPADHGEIREYIRSMESRARSVLLAIRSAKQAITESGWTG